MKSVENEWEQTAMKNAPAPITAKTQQQIDRNSGKRWDWETALRLLNAQTHYPPGCNNYNAFVDMSWEDARINFERSTCWSPPVKKKRPSHQLKGPTSPRIVTSKEHSKHTGMRPTVLSIHSFINIPITLLFPHCMVPNPFRRPLHESL